MKIGPKYKICKRLGPGIFEKCQTPRFALVASRSGKKRGRRGRASRSDYGAHMLEKQRVRFTYGIPERQLSRYVREAALARGARAADTLYRRLESRLDNIVYRLALARTRLSARQLVTHGHIAVNDKRITSPSHVVRVGERVGVVASRRERGPFRILIEEGADARAAAKPDWLTYDEKKKEGTVLAHPSPDPRGIAPYDLQTVVEFYSR
jgi:small subunit ribosomal protein S4